MTAPTSGTPAITSAASELETFCSADPRSTHGIAISTAAKAASHRQRARTGRRSTVMSAIGSRIAAAMPVRASTRNAGDTSATAIRMKR